MKYSKKIYGFNAELARDLNISVSKPIFLFGGYRELSMELFEITDDLIFTEYIKRTFK